MKFLLRIVTEDSIKEFSLKKPCTYIGRKSNSDILLNDNLVSAKHAKLNLSKGVLEIFDLGSKNGTKVNGISIDHTFLRNNDRIQIGDTELVAYVQVTDEDSEIHQLDKTICLSSSSGNPDLNFNDLQSELQFHFNIIKSCSIMNDNEQKILLATKPEARYPFFYPRDGACAARLFRKYSISDLPFKEEAYQLLKDMACFIKDIQREDGYWGQRYSVTGKDETIYIQEDNVAHAIATICNYLLTANALKIEVKDLNDYLDALNRGCQFALKNYYHNEIHLFYSTTSVHESALEQGFTCWVNFAYLYALTLIFEVCEQMDLHNKISDEAYDIRIPLESNLLELLSENGRFIRRIDAQGIADYRADVTMMSPFYFGFQSEKIEDIIENTMRIVRRQLWDPQLGLLQRYLPFKEDNAVHVHAGNGAWINYSAILAQYYYHKKSTEMGDTIMGLINKHRNDAGEIPEHISTLKRYRDFMKYEWDTGLDFEKEFEKSIMIEDIKFEKILEEALKMHRSYIDVEGESESKDENMSSEGCIRFCTPLMWSHVEYSKALLARSDQTFFSRDRTQMIKNI